MSTTAEPYVSTTNACKLCRPLGACIAFRGIEGAIPFLHGSQGCATYMRRYIISHYREPMDIASSSLGEKHAVYGGGPNLKVGLKNVVSKYECSLVGIATTCLTETIGDDVSMLVKEFRQEFSACLASHGEPELVNVSTPSYSGTHMEGFHAAVRAVVERLAEDSPDRCAVNLFPGFVSPADTRYLKQILNDFGLEGVVLPDISLTLDGPAQAEYERIPAGGTPVHAIRTMGGARASLEFGRSVQPSLSAGGFLQEKFGVPLHPLGTPIGLRETDRFFGILESLAAGTVPAAHDLERGRLIDAYVDGHKYVYGKKAVVYGEEDLVTGLASFLAEIGVTPVLCASGGRSGRLREAIEGVMKELGLDLPSVHEGADFYEISEAAEALKPDLLIGNSKGCRLARRLDIPLVRVGFPIHDRFGGQRTLHLGYRGALALLDRLINALIERRQENSHIGYGYM